MTGVQTCALPISIEPTLSAALLGEHTDAVLTELGLDDAAIASLRDRGIVA